MQTFLTRADETGCEPFDSVAWALETHVKQPDLHVFNAAILSGNEDAPDKIEFWHSANPDHDTPADFIWSAHG